MSGASSRLRPAKLVGEAGREANQAFFPVSTMARVLGVSKAGHHAWRHRPLSSHAVVDAALLKRVRTVHASSRQTYGAPRVHADLQSLGERHGRKRIARLVREAGLVGGAARGSGMRSMLEWLRRGEPSARRSDNNRA